MSAFRLTVQIEQKKKSLLFLPCFCYRIIFIRSTIGKIRNKNETFYLTLIIHPPLECFKKTYQSPFLYTSHSYANQQKKPQPFSSYPHFSSSPGHIFLVFLALPVIYVLIIHTASILSHGLDYNHISINFQINLYIPSNHIKQ